MSNVATGGNSCPKCGSELRVSWCAQCYGTGRSGKHKCKACGGKGDDHSLPECSLTQAEAFSDLDDLHPSGSLRASRRHSENDVVAQARSSDARRAPT